MGTSRSPHPLDRTLVTYRVHTGQKHQDQAHRSIRAQDEPETDQPGQNQNQKSQSHHLNMRNQPNQGYRLRESRDSLAAGLGILQNGPNLPSRECRIRG